MSIIGTKYSKGDVVVKRENANLSPMAMDKKNAKFYDVIKVKNPESRSPDYILRERGGDRQTMTVKASDIKKVM